MEGHVLIGTVARTHGNRGEVIVNLETDFPEERFREGAILRARGVTGQEQPLTITGVRFHQGRPILALEGFGSISEAERLAGWDLWMHENEQQALPEGVFWHHQLIGSQVVTTGGEVVGPVTAVEGDAATSRLVIAGRGGEVLIPLADDLCRVDVAARRIVVTPVEGLLDLNGRWQEIAPDEATPARQPGAPGDRQGVPDEERPSREAG